MATEDDPFDLNNPNGMIRPNVEANRPQTGAMPPRLINETHVQNSVTQLHSRDYELQVDIDVANKRIDLQKAEIEKLTRIVRKKTTYMWIAAFCSATAVLIVVILFIRTSLTINSLLQDNTARYNALTNQVHTVEQSLNFKLDLTNKSLVDLTDTQKIMLTSSKEKCPARNWYSYNSAMPI